MAEDRGGAIVIGGMGGSGTRAVASVLRALGVNLVGPLNESLDSQWATLLLKRPRWLSALQGHRPVAEIVQSVLVLRAMCQGSNIGLEHRSVLARAADECARAGQHAKVDWWRSDMPFRLVEEFHTRTPVRPQGPWGWKEPVNQVLLPEIAAACPDLRYVHVARHPFDMAWSKNNVGVRLWGQLCGIDAVETDTRPQSAQLAWWLYSNEHVLATSREWRERFAFVRFEHLCEDPVEGARQLALFAGLEPDEQVIRQAAEQVRSPGSLGRWRQLGVDGIDSELLERAREWARAWDQQ